MVKKHSDVHGVASMAALGFIQIGLEVSMFVLSKGRVYMGSIYWGYW